MTITVQSAFQKYESKCYPFQFEVEIHIPVIAGGVASDPNVAKGWLKSRLANSDALLAQMVLETMEEIGCTEEEAFERAAMANLTVFKRDEDGLYLEGRCLKACLKESAVVAANAGHYAALGWGSPTDKNYKKGIKGWFPEHVFVKDDRLHFGVDAPSGINQRAISVRERSALKYEEFVEDVTITAHIETDFNFKEEQWAAIWLTAQRQGLGASRSQGFGVFTVVEWREAE